MPPAFREQPQKIANPFCAVAGQTSEKLSCRHPLASGHHWATEKWNICFSKTNTNLIMINGRRRHSLIIDYPGNLTHCYWLLMHKNKSAGLFRFLTSGRSYLIGTTKQENGRPLLPRMIIRYCSQLRPAGSCQVLAWEEFCAPNQDNMGTMKEAIPQCRYSGMEEYESHSFLQSFGEGGFWLLGWTYEIYSLV